MVPRCPDGPGGEKPKDTMKTYHRETIEALPPTTDRSAIYWRAQARKIFRSRSDVNTVIVARNKSDVLPRGVRHAKPGEYVVTPATQGRYGKSRQDFPPVTRNPGNYFFS